MLSAVQLYCTTRCDHVCSFCRVRSSYPGDADFDKIAGLLLQIKELRIPYVDFTGGNPLLCDWLGEALKLSNRLDQVSSLTVSGPMIARRGEELIGLPTILRFSIDGDESYHNHHGHGFYPSILHGLELARSVRQNRPTQLLFTVMPGEKGNIRSEIFCDVLRLAREFGVMINVNPLFDSEFSSDEMELLLWFAKQADVQTSRGKLRFIARGGNNIQNPTCKAVSSVLTISSDNRLVLPCFHREVGSISLDDLNLREAVNSSHRLKAMKMQGKHAFCQGCSIWCYIIPSWITLAPQRVVALLQALSLLQTPRDAILRFCGKLNSKFPYPSFNPKG